MIRNILLGSLLALGPLVELAPAQQISVGFGRGGVDLRIGVGHRAPVVHRPAAGHWETRRERIWVDGCERVVHVPAEFAWRRDACGRPVRVCVRPAHDRIVRDPGRWEWCERRVWIAHDTRGRGPGSRRGRR